MAHQDTEIEIKIALNEREFSRIKEILQKTAKFVKSSKQSDTYYTPSHRNFVEPRYPWEWLSLRQRDGKAILTYKHWHPAGAEEHTHCDEYETAVDRPEQLEKVFKALDFRELVTVEKLREIFIFNEEFEIALDIVKDLGHFIEIEAMKDLGDVEATRERLLEFARGLDIDISKLEKRGYPYQLMKKRGLLKQDSQ